jgi:kynureninase
MQLQPDFVPREGAEGWQISNPPIFAMAPLVASLELFDRATMPALREKSIRLTGYLRWLLERIGAKSKFEIITPREVEACGCQLSLLVHDRPRQVLDALGSRGVVCDFREPNVIRVAPTPMYNTFHEVWRFAQMFCGCLP